MICLEWVSYEIVVFVLGSIGEVELAINSILVNLLVIMFMVRVELHLIMVARMFVHLAVTIIIILAIIIECFSLSVLCKSSTKLPNITVCCNAHVMLYVPAFECTSVV